ncbi:cell division protein FtsB [Vibrio orientalis CIP 102891 = ATCC 33934]|jgi:cell division protein FtsB|uniref:Cell division protein FtsB n=1 Tax=Vibrio orientalis CIP 102891 = ATCC 33934 TaxID=675816 RepID=C9QCI3_VIBOR|nr:cell division protein FtsB [Vibrio orientalis]EEX95324.1 cell division protein FtsB [Vibrio orientalis CIP 102891 = ATCC 33934]EGU52362.1 cell division protein FtsB [Vibrio orientalis CIP 102891 = ATCC 33934]
MRIFALTLLLVLGWLQAELWFGKNGISDFQAVNAETQVQHQVNSNLQGRNNEMFAEIDDLRQGLDAIEERARHELGMIKEGETFYRIIGDDN